jgi:hypothetical protein
MVDGADMKFRNEPCHTTLTTDQMNELVAIVLETQGSMLRRPDFNDAMSMLFEDIAGLELLTNSQRNRLLKILWSRYQRSNSADQRH